jgi:hypothetical protein
MSKARFLGFLMFATIAAAIFSACSADNLEPGIPAFVQVEHFNLQTNYAQEGTNSHKITDVWVFADDQTIGVFELPATIPILKNGPGKLRLEAGIKLNGIKTTRVNNTFFEPVIIEPYIFIPDSIATLNPTVTYRTQNVFVWMEDFESGSISIDTTRLLSKANIVLSPIDEAFEGSFSGLIELTTDNNIFEAASFESFVLPASGKPVFLEMNYKNEYTFSVGIFSQTSGEIIKKEIIYLSPQEDWNKIYINLTEKLIESQNAVDFKIFFRTVLPESLESANIYLDNIKLMYR